MDMPCFSFVMMYGLSSDNILYSTSNQSLYVNKTLLHFLNIKQEFSFMNWFLCLSHVSLGQHWGNWNKKMSKTSNIPYVQAIYVVVYRSCGLKLLYTILWTIMLWTRFDMYSISCFFFICYFDVLSLTFGPLSSEQPYSPDVNNWSLGMLYQVWFPKPGLVPSVVWTENILIQSQYLNPVGYSPEKTFMEIAHLPRLTPSLIFYF